MDGQPGMGDTLQSHCTSPAALPALTHRPAPLLRACGSDIHLCGHLAVRQPQTPQGLGSRTQLPPRYFVTPTVPKLPEIPHIWPKPMASAVTACLREWPFRYTPHPFVSEATSISSCTFRVCMSTLPSPTSTGCGCTVCLPVYCENVFQLEM